MYYCWNTYMFIGISTQQYAKLYKYIRKLNEPSGFPPYLIETTLAVLPILVNYVAN